MQYVGIYGSDLIPAIQNRPTESNRLSIITNGEEMGNHTHNFVETYSGLVGFGLDRSTDESTLIYYLQKFSDDTLMKRLIPKLPDADLELIFNLINRILRENLSDSEYHLLFLKDE